MEILLAQRLSRKVAESSYGNIDERLGGGSITVKNKCRVSSFQDFHINIRRSWTLSTNLLLHRIIAYTMSTAWFKKCQSVDAQNIK